MPASAKKSSSRKPNQPGFWNLQKKGRKAQSKKRLEKFEETWHGKRFVARILANAKRWKEKLSEK